MPDKTPENEETVPIKGPLGDVEEIKEVANSLGVSYKLALEVMADVATCEGLHPKFKLQAAAEIAKILRMYPERGGAKTVIETDAQKVHIYLPDNGRDNQGEKTDG